jgi:hypothetical protein
MIGHIHSGKLYPGPYADPNCEICQKYLREHAEEIEKSFQQTMKAVLSEYDEKPEK